MKALTPYALAAALFAAIPASTALAGTIELSAPRAGASLHSGEIVLSAYFVAAADGALEVVATYADKAAAYHPRRIVMALRDGDQSRFGLPGHPGTLYTFSRDGEVVTISDQAGSPSLDKLTKARQAGRLVQ